MLSFCVEKGRFKVVPRKGDVDRNDNWALISAASMWSSPARGTWIEMPCAVDRAELYNVVPRKGDVDRNADMSA